MKSTGENKNLSHEEAINKIKTLVGHNKICMFASNLNEPPFHTRPMSTQRVDDDGCLWFISSKESDKNAEIGSDPRVQLFYANESRSEYLTIYGEAEIVTDKEKIDELWNPMANAWFEEGKDDPEVTLLKVIPEDAYYYDTKQGRIASMIKILTSAVTGASTDPGVKGRLRV